VRQVGHLQELSREARSKNIKFKYIIFATENTALFLACPMPGKSDVTDTVLAEIATTWTRIQFMSAVNKHEVK
jgi:hypothetical protein